MIFITSRTINQNINNFLIIIISFTDYGGTIYIDNTALS